MPMWGATARRGRAPRGRYSRRPRAVPARRRVMGNFLSMAAYNAVGGLVNRYKRKRTSSKKKGVLKKRKMASKSRTRKGTALKTTTAKVRAAHAKMSDQRVTKMKFEDDGAWSVHEVKDNNRGYFAVQDTGGYRTVCLAVAGSFLRDTLSKNGIKFPSWNTHTEEAGSNAYWDTVMQRCFGIQFYFSRTDSAADGLVSDSGVTITEAGLPWASADARAEMTKLYLPSSNSSVPTSPFGMKTLYELTDELADILYFWAIKGFYPSAYEIVVQVAGPPRREIVKFRESNWGAASLSLLIDTKYQITNWSPASGGGTDQYESTRIDKVPLQFTKFKMRNLGIKMRDPIISAAESLNYPVQELSVVNQLLGYTDVSSLKNASEVWFNPFERTPNGPTAFKNMASRSTFGLQPGKSATENLTFSYSGAFADLFKRVIQQETAVKVTYSDGTSTPEGTQTIDESNIRKVSGPMVPGGSVYLFAYERIKLMSSTNAVAHKDRRLIRTYCSFQPFKSAPLPVYNRTTDWET